MKKKGLLILGVAGMLSLCATGAMAAENITVMVNGESLVMEQAPVSRNNRTLVPMRAIFEALDAKVDWDGQTQAITATKDDLTVKMAINQKDMTVNGQTVTLDAAPTLVNDSTMVPVRAVAESFQATVNWDEANRQVTITTAADEEVNSTPTGKISEVVKAADGAELITIAANYPVLDNKENAGGITTINAAFKKMAEDYVASVKEEYQKEVEAFYLEKQEGFTAYAFEMNVTLDFDETDILSGVVTEYANTGGAHPNTVKTGFAYNKATGAEMALTDVMVGTEAEIQEKVIAAFEALIDEAPDTFSEDAKATLEKEIANVEFYMAEDGVHFFFQLYTIAPYSSGFQEVVFPYAEDVTVYTTAAAE